MGKLNKTGWGVNETAAFVRGYAYAQAEQMKKEGCFPDYTTNELTQLILNETIKNR